MDFRLDFNRFPPFDPVSDLLGRADDFQILSLLRLDDILALVLIINHSFLTRAVLP